MHGLSNLAKTGKIDRCGEVAVTGNSTVFGGKFKGQFTVWNFNERHLKNEGLFPQGGYGYKISQ